MHASARFLVGSGLLATSVLIACEPSVQPDIVAPSFSRVQVIAHSVSAGGADLCEAVGLPTGCDANWSIVAHRYADGTVTGQWQDVIKFGGPLVAFHARVDCLHVEGNHAWIGGELTVPRAAAGLRVVTNVVDNGVAKHDVLDQVGLAESEASNGPCTSAPDLFLFDLTHGQVTVR